MEGRGVAAVKRTAADLGAYICFEDEAGQGLRPPKGRTWAPRGARPAVRVRGRGNGRVNIAGAVCYRPGDRPHIFYRLHVYHGRKGEPKTFAWHEYRDLIITAHQQLNAPLVWCWDNLNVHLAKELRAFTEEHADWLQIFQMPSYAPELNPAEGVWSLPKRAIANFVAADLRGLVRIVKRKLKKIQFRPHLIDGCLAGTGLIIEPWGSLNLTLRVQPEYLFAYRAACSSWASKCRCARSMTSSGSQPCARSQCRRSEMALIAAASVATAFNRLG